MNHTGKVDIQPFQASQLDDIHRLAMATIDASYAPVYSDEAVTFFKKYHAQASIRLDAETGYACVIYQANRLMATGTLMGDYAKRVFVDPERQGQGLGRKIMQHLEARARDQGIKVIRLDASLPSKPFYDALDYVTVCKTFVPLTHGKQLDYYEMRKKLSGGDAHA